LPGNCISVIFHFPPELLFGAPTWYQAIFLNGWEYLYVDSFGLTKNDVGGTDAVKKNVGIWERKNVGNEEEESVGTNLGNTSEHIVKQSLGNSSADSVENHLRMPQNSTELEVDAHAWIYWAFGFNSASISQNSVISAFKSMFFELISHFSFSPVPPGKNLHYSCDFYLQKNPQLFLKQFFTQHPWLYHEVIFRFAKKWTSI